MNTTKVKHPQCKTDEWVVREQAPGMASVRQLAERLTVSTTTVYAVVVKIDVAFFIFKQPEFLAAVLCRGSATRLQPVTSFWYHHSNAVDAGLEPADRPHDVWRGFLHPVRCDAGAG